MYKVFVNNKAIHFVKNINERILNTENTVVLRFYSKKIMMDSYNEFIADKDLSDLYIYNPSGITNAFHKFCDEFKIISAGGGLVKDGKHQKFLFIFRRDKWDLPKGKQEKGEQIRFTALREVEEETGIGNLVITEKLNITYHIYTEKKGEVLKITHWYSMLAKNPKEPTPQTNEDITEAKWLSKAEIKDALLNTYPSITLVMEDYFKRNKRKIGY